MNTKSVLTLFILFFFVSVINAAESTMVFNGITTNHNGLTVSFLTGNFTGSIDGSKMNLYANHPEGNPINGGNDYKDITISTATYVARVTVVWAFNVAGFKLQFLRNNSVVKEISGFNAGGNITSATNFSVNEVVDVIRYLDAGVSNSGAFELSQITFDSALPVELSSFTANVKGSNVELTWQTATEVNNYGFEILRQAQDDKEWAKIGFVNGNGNSNSAKSYSYEDKNVIAGNPAYRTGRYSYSLKQIDGDGKFEYSKTVAVDFNSVEKFELSQNYPNPFNPSTTIRFNLTEAGNVKLTLFNILGQEIKTLVNEVKEAGVHTFNFDASEFMSGMYLYKIETGTFVQTRKMTLVQ